jgi:phage protein D/phage baseplate assembly protein gpV
MSLFGNDNETVTIEFTVNGAASKLSPHVYDIQIEKSINKICRASIRILDGDVALQKFDLFESNTVNIGDPIVIKIGGTPTSVSAVFTGIVTGIATEISLNKSFIIIHCADKAIGMTKGRNTQIFLKKKDDAIMKALIGNYSGVTATTDSCTIEHEKLVQYGVSDWDFLLMRAQANGFLVANFDNKVIAKKPVLSSSASFTYSYGTDILAFESHATGEPAIKSMSVQHWDYDTGKVKIGASDTTDVPPLPTITTATKIKDMAAPKEAVGVYTAGIHKADSLKGIVNGKIVRSLLASYTGFVTVLGEADVELGDIVEIKGMGKMSGKFYCSGIQHSFSDGMFTTTMNFGINEKSIWEQLHSVNNETLGGSNSPVTGLHLGKVTKLDGDPNSQLRIQILLPNFGTDALVWARLTFPDAGKGRGIFFVPEKDDEVVVSFLDGDPSQPVILGTLYNKTNTPPEAWKAENNMRKIVSKNKVSIEFDDEKKNLTLKTPGGNSILMDDAKGITIKDKNGNSIELGTAGITIKSAKDATVKATKNLTLQADAGPVKIAGLQITAEAKTTLKLAGKATAEISAAGILTVKGALVKIN